MYCRVMIGDMNARIGNERGKVGDGEKWMSGRESKDAVKNAEGKRLMNLCDRTGLMVMNGRCKEDRERNITLVGDKEGSVIDYISESKEYIVKELKTEARPESDHLPVTSIGS